MTTHQVKLGDSIEVLRQTKDCSVDAIVTDPPYGLSFMGKKWDYDVPSVDLWRECLRVLKPGGHMLVACGTRTQHRMAVNIEDAGFEIRDVITWLYGSGFPKSLDISKAIDKAAGAERPKKDMTQIDGERSIAQTIHASCNICGKRQFSGNPCVCPDPSKDAQTPEAKQWQGWGTALKPACEFWTLARKPLSEATVAKNVLKHGTGGINVDGCRVEAADQAALEKNWDRVQLMAAQEGRNSMNGGLNAIDLSNRKPIGGRFPSNLILDEEAGAALDEQSGFSKSPGKTVRGAGGQDGKYSPIAAQGTVDCPSDSGGASRFFYCAKASKSERNAGLEGMPAKQVRTSYSKEFREKCGNDSGPSKQNHHPTVKPIKLMRYLCRLITPPGGTVLDPFLGSGSTLVAAKLEGFNGIGIEREAEYVEISKKRIEATK